MKRSGVRIGLVGGTGRGLWCGNVLFFNPWNRPLWGAFGFGGGRDCSLCSSLSSGPTSRDIEEGRCHCCWAVAVLGGGPGVCECRRVKLRAGYRTQHGRGRVGRGRRETGANRLLA